MRQVKTRSVNDGTNPGLADEIAAALEWWRDAGVDCDYHDAPAQWLAKEEPAAPVMQEAAPLPQAAPPSGLSAEPAPQAPIDRTQWPRDLADFPAWWTSETWLDNGTLAARVPPRGPAHAELMVLVPEPEREDVDELLSGRQGRLLAAMLSAMGLLSEHVYIASALTRHTPHADWEGAARNGLGEVLRHHIALAMPKRIIAFGNNILPLLGNDPANNAAPYSEFYHEELRVPLLVGRELAALLERPRWKAAFWTSWLDWPASRMGTVP